MSQHAAPTLLSIIGALRGRYSFSCGQPVDDGILSVFLSVFSGYGFRFVASSPWAYRSVPRRHGVAATGRPAGRFAAAAALFLAASHAFPQADDGFYLSAATLATFLRSTRLRDRPQTRRQRPLHRPQEGGRHFRDVDILGFRAAFGYSFFGFRPEAELSYRQVGLSGFQYSSFSQDGAELSPAALDALNDSIVVKSGSLGVLGAMANLWFDIPTGTPLSPFLGGGVGFGRVTLDSRSSARLSGVSVLREFPESSASAFAFQAGAGLSVSLGYRLYGTSEATLAWNAKGSSADEILRISVLLHSIDIGVSYRF